MGSNVFRECLGLQQVKIRFTGSDIKVNIPTDSWFWSADPGWGTDYALVIQVPVAINSTVAPLVYGAHWNANTEEQMMLTLKHELMHVWLYENGHTNQSGNEVFNYEDVCELVALSNNSINRIVEEYLYYKNKK